MMISDKGLDFIKGWEKLELKAYKPTPDDVLTVGYGHTHGVFPGMIITPYEAEQFLLDDLKPVMDFINTRVLVPLDQEQFDALCSLVFNVGWPSFQKSTALADLNRHDVDGFIDQAFSREHGWTKQNGHILPGLVNRRAAECKLFVHGLYT